MASPEVRDARPHDAGHVDSWMIEELIVFGGEKSPDRLLRNFLVRNDITSFLVELSKQRVVPAVVSKDARDDRRLVISDRDESRYLFVEMPEHEAHHETSQHGAQNREKENPL